MKKILIVEDEMVQIFLLKTQLKNMGHRSVDVAANGEAAIRALKLHEPDLIIMDVCIDGPLDGIQTMDLIRQFSSVPVLYVTVDPNDHTRQRAAQTPRSWFLPKPLEPNLLHAHIRAIFP